MVLLGTHASMEDVGPSERPWVMHFVFLILGFPPFIQLLLYDSNHGPTQPRNLIWRSKCPASEPQWKQWLMCNTRAAPPCENLLQPILQNTYECPNSKSNPDSYSPNIRARMCADRQHHRPWAPVEHLNLPLEKLLGQAQGVFPDEVKRFL